MLCKALQAGKTVIFHCTVRYTIYIVNPNESQVTVCRECPCPLSMSSDMYDAGTKHKPVFDRLIVLSLTRVAQDAKWCMAWGAIEGNRTHPFDAQDAKHWKQTRSGLEVLVSARKLGKKCILPHYIQIAYYSLARKKNMLILLLNDHR